MDDLIAEHEAIQAHETMKEAAKAGLTVDEYNSKMAAVKSTGAAISDAKKAQEEKRKALEAEEKQTIAAIENTLIRGKDQRAALMQKLHRKYAQASVYCGILLL